MALKKGLLKALPAFLVEYCNQSTIQGLNHIVAPRRHILERIFWAVVVVWAVFSAASLILSSYKRFQTDPTVISLDKNYRNWDTPLPGTTLCFQDKLNKTKAGAAIRRVWNVKDGSRYDYYMEFLSCLANANYDTLKACVPFAQDQALKSLDLASLISEINFQEAKMSGGTFKDDNVFFHTTLTERGLCFSFNSLLTQYFHLGMKPKNETKGIDPPMCKVSKPLCYGRIINLHRSLRFYTHSPYNIQQETDDVLAPIGYDTRGDYQALSTEATTAVRELQPPQRRCLFFDEKATGEAPFYTYNLCMMNCRRSLALKLCGCVPFFYIKRESQPVCSIQDVPCLEKHSVLLKTLVNQEDRTKYPCKCLPDCSAIIYYRTSIAQTARKGSYDGTPSNSTAVYEWALETLPRTKLKRDVLYNADDLLVAWGGTAGFFLGCSIISAIEFVYFFSIRIVRCMFCKKSGNRKPEKPVLMRRKPRNVLAPYKTNRALGDIRDLPFHTLQPMRAGFPESSVWQKPYQRSIYQ